MIKGTLTALGFVCALGKSKDEICKNASSGSVSGMITDSVSIPNKKVPFGAVDIPVTERLRCFELLDLALAQISDKIEELKQKYRPERIGVVLGSSNTGIQEAQEKIDSWLDTNVKPDNFSFDEIKLGTPAVYLRQKTGVLGPAYTVSTACSSSAKVFASASYLLEKDICDAVLVGGVDSLCRLAMNGFNALEALSDEISNPMSKNRKGINLGEGAAIFTMERNQKGIVVAGIGETSDGYHLTSPDPEGKGAILSMKLALKHADIKPEYVDFINLHGTGTEANDAMESRAVNAVFGNSVLCASTKPMTGHALGASGAIELALSWLMLKNQFIIPHVYDGVYDDVLPPILLATKNDKKSLKYILSNSFAFGGSNASVILGKTDDI